jgi:hypothetical protein
MKTDYQLSNETYLADKAWEAGNRWVQKSDKWEKFDFLKESCSTEFLQETLPLELLKFMSEDDVDELFEHLRRNWEMKTPPELDYEMSL